jgi:hypothetical protein
MWRSFLMRIRMRRPWGIRRPAALDPVLVGDEGLRVERQAAVELLVVEEQKAGRALGGDLDVDLDLVGLIARDEGERRRILRRGSAGGQHQGAVKA